MSCLTGNAAHFWSRLASSSSPSEGLDIKTRPGPSKVAPSKVAALLGAGKTVTWTGA